MSFSDYEFDEEITQKSGAPDFQVKALLATLARFYWIVILTTVLAAIGALIFLKNAQPIYKSTAEMKIESRYATPGLNLATGSKSWNEMAASEDVSTLSHSFLNANLMERVIEVMDLKNRDNFIAPNRPAASVSDGELLGYLMANSSVNQVAGTRLLEISFSNWNPTTAQQVADALVLQGIENDRDQRIKAVEANIKYLQNESKRLEKDLRTSEEKRLLYIRNLGTISIDEQSDFMSRQILEVNTSLLNAKAERIAVESDFNQAQSLLTAAEAEGAEKGLTEKEIEQLKVNNLLTIQSIRDIPAVVALGLRANELQANRAKLLQRYRPENPFVRQADSELGEVVDSLQKEVISAPESLRLAQNLAQEKERQIVKQMDDLENTALEVKDKSVQAQVYQRQIDASRLAYEAALNRLNEEQSQSHSQPVLLQVVSPAGFAYRATLQPVNVFGTTVAGGAIFGLLIVGAISQLSKTIRSAEDAESSLRQSVISVIPNYHPERGSADESSEVLMPTLHSKTSATAEAFRTLRAFLQINEEVGKSNFVLFTGGGSGDGTSFCAINLAISLAQSGQRTLLVDADLRHPTLERSLLGADRHYGLSDYLEGNGSFSSVLRATPIPYLDIVPAGSQTWHSSELLSQPVFKKFLDEAEEVYDRIIFDSAPISAVSDTLSFARLASVVWVVVRVEKSSKPEVQRSLELLSRSGAKIAGLVVNGTKSHASGEYADSEIVPAHSAEEGFPLRCNSCDRTYMTYAQLMEKTLPPDDTKVEAGLPNRRKCECGAIISLPTVQRRDTSSEGQRRRDLFGSLLEDLRKGGMGKEDARQKLLLTLKISRNEDAWDAPSDGSEAARRRKELFEEILQNLENANVDRAQAILRLQHAIQIWRKAP